MEWLRLLIIIIKISLKIDLMLYFYFHPDNPGEVKIDYYILIMNENLKSIIYET